jgi:hypothetical protein
MRQILFGLLMFLATDAVAQIDKAQVDLFKREAAALQAAVDEAVQSLVPGPDGVLERPRAAYLEGYGVVVSLQATFGPTRNPFSSPKTPAEVRKIVNERKKAVQDRLEKLLKERIATMQSVGEAGSISIALHLLNANPADLPDFPSQLLLTVKKAEPTQVRILEF